MRRRLFENEVGVDPTNQEQMEVLAEILEIQADGGDDAAKFVSYAIEQLDREMLARRAERRAKKLRQQADEAEQAGGNQ